MNSHPRDKNIKFIEDNHTYIVNGNIYTSVTTIIHKFFPEFNADIIIDKMMKSPKFKYGPYKGMNKQQIKDQWEAASAAGTLMHKDIENFINNEPVLNTEAIEFKYFLNFWNEIVINNLEPYRAEWMIYSNNGIAGTIDCVLINEDGELVLLDWKRSKEIKFTNQWEKGLGPFKHLDNCNYNHYSLQLNIYRHILETEYDKKVIGMFNVVLHPNQDNYQLIEIKRINLVSIIDEIISK